MIFQNRQQKKTQQSAHPEAPTLDTDNTYQNLKQRIHRKLVASLDLASVNDVTNPEARRELDRFAREFIKAETPGLTAPSRERLFADLQDELYRFGPLENLLRDDTICDILVNSPSEIFIERDGRLQRSKVTFADQEHLLRIVQRIVGMAGRRLDRSSPLVDARLPDGSRVNAVVPPLSLGGAKLSIRRFRKGNFNMAVLSRNGSLNDQMMRFLNAAVEARVSILFSGGTGTGKTTLLSALSSAIPRDERLVTIEDSAELVLQHPHVVRMETRPANQEGSCEFTVRDLVRNSLRMRPDRIIIGEVRGAEAIDMIQAMNTGHEGSMTTLHANGPRDALTRLELMIAMGNIDLPVTTIREFIALGIPLLVHTSRLKGGVRKLTRIAELKTDGRGNIDVVDIFRFVQEGIDETGAAVGRFVATGHKPDFVQRFEEQGIEFDPADLSSTQPMTDGGEA